MSEKAYGLRSVHLNRRALPAIGAEEWIRPKTTDIFSRRRRQREREREVNDGEMKWGKRNVTQKYTLRAHSHYWAVRQ